MGSSTRLYSAGGTGAIVPSGRVPINTQAGNQGSLPALQTVLVNTETVIADPANTANALVVTIPPGGPCEQEPFELVASGYMNLGTSSTVTLKIYYGTTISGTLIKSSGALSAFSGKTNWWINAKLIYDSISGTLTGKVEFFANNVIVPYAAITAVPTGISNTTFNGVANFCLSVTFGTAGTQIINVKDFGVNH